LFWLKMQVLKLKRFFFPDNEFGECKMIKVKYKCPINYEMFSKPINLEVLWTSRISIVQVICQQGRYHRTDFLVTTSA